VGWSGGSGTPGPSIDSAVIRIQVGWNVTPIRPKFSNPPLIERAIGVAFDPLPSFSIGDYGLFWSELIGEFPLSEAMEPVSVEVEQFSEFRPAQASFQIVPASVLPRAGFRNPATGELIQVQPNRFGFNWIKTGVDHQYPHSEATFERFFHLLERFAGFVERRGYGPLSFVQCELTNVNVIPVADVGESFVDIATVIRMPRMEISCAELRLENQLIGAKHAILDDGGNPIGRVHSLGQPTLRVEGDEQVYRLDIVARGAPIGAGVDGLKRFYEFAVTALNGVFLGSVTQAGRKFWGEHHG